MENTDLFELCSEHLKKTSLFEFCSKHLEEYEIVAAIVNGNITAEIINYINSKDYTDEEFSEEINVPYEKVQKWISATYDFTVEDLSFLAKKKIISINIFDCINQEKEK